MNMLGLKRGAEIGVKAGEHAEVMCQNIENIELLCVDSWHTGLEGNQQRTANRMAPYNATLIKKISTEAARDVPYGSLDFVYIDANHNFDFVMEDLITWGRKVRPGGMIAGHDYDRAHLKGVVPAVDTYTKYHGINEWFITDQKREASFFWIKQG